MSQVIIKLQKLHPGQQQIMSEAKRFNVLKCGRRFGKTALTLELTINPMLDGKIIGYWTPTYKDLEPVWEKLKTQLSAITVHKDETLKTIKLVTGGQLDMWSLENPDNGRGRAYHRIIIDEAEKSRNTKKAWEEAIMGTLLDFSGDAWFLSTPKFGQTYFKRTLFTNQDKLESWKSWRFSSYDNPHLPEGEVESIRLVSDPLTFRCEYLAEDVDLTLRPFAYCFDEAKHVGSCTYQEEHELYLSFDFNVDPITCLAAQHIDGEIRFIKEFKLSNSNIYELCDAILVEFDAFNPVYLITGDSSGKSRSALVTSGLNYYRVIQKKLNVSTNQIKLPRTNPNVGDTRVLMNSILQNATVIIDKSCEGFVYDLKYVEVNDEGDIIKDRSSDARKADMLDCGRYMLNTFFRWFLKSLDQDAGEGKN